MSSSMEALHDAALEVASHGLQIIRVYGLHEHGGKLICTCPKGADCPSPGKHPISNAWQTTGTKVESTIDGWFHARPGMSFGCLWGDESNAIDIEADCPEAEQLYSRLFGGEPPIAPTFQSHRGKHRIFRPHPGLPKTDQSVLKIGPLEFRIGGGGKAAQSVMPPCPHESGEPRFWLPGCTLDDVPPPTIDDDTIARICQAYGAPHTGNGDAAAAATADIETLAMQGAKEPGRHDAAKRLAGSFVAGCTTEAEYNDAWETVVAWNSRNRGKDGRLEPLPEKELRDIFAWTSQQERKKKPGERWAVVIVTSSPPMFKLATPYYPGTIELTATQYLSWSRIRTVALEQKRCLLPAGEGTAWKGDADTEALAAKLIRTATEEESDAELIRTDAIIELVRDHLAEWVGGDSGRWQEENGPLSIGRLPARDAEGGVYFTFSGLLERVAKLADKVKRPELIAALKTIGATSTGVGTGNARRNVKYLPPGALAGAGLSRDARPAEV